MKLAAEHWRSLSQLLDEALALSEAERVAWAAQLGEEHASLKPLLEELFAHPAAVSTADLLVGTLPAFAPPEEAERGAGAIVGPYRLLRELGRGGMGAVWLAERVDGLIKRGVALKLPILAASRATLAERFAREREILAPARPPAHRPALRRWFRGRWATVISPSSTSLASRSPTIAIELCSRSRSESSCSSRCSRRCSTRTPTSCCIAT